MTAPLGRRLLAEGVGTALLVAVVVGSGIAAQQLSPDNAPGPVGGGPAALLPDAGP